MSCMPISNATFDFNINYLPVFYNGVQVSAEILEDNANIEGMETLIISARPRSFAPMSNVQEESAVINHVTGQEMVRMKIFYMGVWLACFTGWNIYDEETNEMVPIEQELVGNMFDTIVKYGAKKYINITKNNNQNKRD